MNNVNKVIIIFSSPRQQTGEWDIWKNCKNNTSNSGVSISPDNDISIFINGNTWKIYVFNGGGSDLSQIGNWNIECLKNKIEELVKQHNNAEIAIFIHGDEHDKKNLQENISGTIISYSSQIGNFYNQCIKPFSQGATEENFNKLWEEVKRGKAKTQLKEIERLRYEILSPLVAIDLLKQAGKKMPEGIEEKIKEINMDKLISGLSDKITIKEDIKGKIKNLFDNYKNYSGEKNKCFHEELMEVAEELEKIISEIRMN